MEKQPEALRLATVLENKLGGAADEDIEQAAAELRRLHEANQELLEALKVCDDALTWELGGEPLGTLMAEAQYKARAAIAKHGGEK